MPGEECTSIPECGGWPLPCFDGFGPQVLAEPAVAEALRPAVDRVAEWLGEGEGPGFFLSRFGPPAVALRAGLLAVAVQGREGSPVLIYRQPEVGPPDGPPDA